MPHPKLIFSLFSTLILSAAIVLFQPQLSSLFHNLSSANSTDSSSLPQPLQDFTGNDTGQLTLDGILAATNNYRQEQGLSPLTLNSQLNQAAITKANDILAKQYFDHVAPDGTQPADLVTATGYAYLRVGENLALGNFTTDNDLVSAWMNSPGHRANILAPNFSEIGIAAVAGTYENQFAWVAVQTFALPTSACPTVSPDLHTQVETLTQTATTQQNDLVARRTNLENYQTQLQDLTDQFNTFVASANQKLTAGNERIDQGNQIMQSTYDPDRAQDDWDAGAALQSESQQLQTQADEIRLQINHLNTTYSTYQDEYNQLVDTYNSTAANLRSLTEQLNEQINAYNNCISI